MNEFITQFLIECRELVDQAISDLLAVEENAGDVERLHGAFRAFHTLKGSAGIVDFAAMARVAHAAEDVLAKVRSGQLPISRDIVSNCLSCLDLVIQWLEAMQVNGEVPEAADADADADAVISRLGAISSVVEKSGIANQVLQSTSRVSGLSDAATALLQAQIQLLDEKASDGIVGRLLSAGRVATNVLRSSGLVDAIAAMEKAVGMAAAAEDAASLIQAIQELLPSQKPANALIESMADSDVTARVLRVDVERIDALVRLTGELIVTKNAIGHVSQLAGSNSDSQALALMLRNQHAQLGKLVEALQQSVLSIRVLPMRHVFSRFPKLVRELAERLGKPTKLVIEGNETEADKGMVEGLFEPLLHMVRNALDHGIETVEERTRSGKPPVAAVYLRATRSGDAVIVEVEDDGRGLDVETVRAKAAERAVAEPAAIARMSDGDISDLVFAPGFSTANEVTDLSGRGVGMNVVRDSVERLGGTARVVSRRGAGTRVTLTLPFSVMMTRIMTVEVGGQVFGLPLDLVVETARVPRGRIVPVGKGHATVLRNRTIPVVDLAMSVGAARVAQAPAEANIVVVSTSGGWAALEVEQFRDRLDIMLEPMDGLLHGMKGVAGTSMLGDGTVLIVLNVEDILQ
jgi:two-component system chemotaxis sensor kinase CheA